MTSNRESTANLPICHSASGLDAPIVGRAPTRAAYHALRKRREELAAVVGWYNSPRPHTRLGGRTPEERYCHIPPPAAGPRFEPRAQWPSGALRAAPQAKVGDEPGVRLELVVEHYRGRNHLPIVALKRVA